MKFYQVDELGIEREYFVVTEYLFENKKYTIYTDMVSGENGEDFRFLVGNVVNNKIERVDISLEKSILNSFRIERDRIMKQLKEDLLWTLKI